MQPRKVGFIVFVLLFFFQSPAANSFALGVDFIERAHFKEDQSGQFSIEVNLKKINKLIWFIKYLNKDYKHQGITKSIGYKAFSNAKVCLEQIPDISHVCVNYNEKMLSFELSFAFNTIDALNKAMRKINRGLDPAQITYFSLDDGLFVRQDVNGIAKKVLFYQRYDNCLIKSLDLASFFKDTTYTTIHTFDKEIERRPSNPQSELTKDKKTVRIIHSVFAPDQVEESIYNCVHFVK
ncbi:hypothetical protein [Cardinium endosymbiont of Dermatophagoides farinae]|uniref:hypothetical protein n=1 Tax=Cardinium endosymbiont of Dermatophagoides farinae TaxID=2597823 RepID=UPI001181EB2F|nr:hypothetical protein [Cardinium endosymbiont of Dermatophagoides farinae]TSJ80647.1 hypothetical protein FPG78_00995 [Cardinium endosymbiont of Dermatophagoides farinae]